MRIRNLALSGVLALALGGIGWAAETLAPDSPDPWLWLTDIHGAKALARVNEHSARTFAALKAIRITPPITTPFWRC